MPPQIDGKVCPFTKGRKVKTMNMNFIFYRVFLGIVLLLSVASTGGCAEPKDPDELLIENLPAIEDAARSVCSGNSAPQAAAYSPDNGKLHPMVVWRLNAQFGADEYSIDNLHTLYYPKEVSKIELVACVNSEMKQLNSCQYSSLTNSNETMSVTREQEIMTIQIYSAKDGALIDETKFTALAPKGCDQFEEFSEHQTVKPYAGIVPDEEIYGWLFPFTNLLEVIYDDAVIEGWTSE